MTKDEELKNILFKVSNLKLSVEKAEVLVLDLYPNDILAKAKQMQKEQEIILEENLNPDLEFGTLYGIKRIVGLIERLF